MSSELTLEEIQNKIPQHCFEKNVFISTYYFVRDFIFLGILYLFYPHINNIFLKLIWWNLTGLIMWAIFVIGHDCGHGSFSEYPIINEIVGNFCHTAILVPYTGWRLTHRSHHLKHNNVDQDKTFQPWSKEVYDQLHPVKKFFRFSYLVLFFFPIYLTLDTDSATDGNHLNPWNTKIYKTTQEFYSGIISNSLLFFWTSFLFYRVSFYTFVDAYLIPVMIFGCWLVMVTMLHHTDIKGEYFKGENWTFLKGAHSTFDRSYGSIIDHIHHDIGTHFIHHLFFTKIPHYHLVEATEATKADLKGFYQEDKTPIIQAFHDGVTKCLWIEKEGEGYKYKH